MVFLAPTAKSMSVVLNIGLICKFDTYATQNANTV